MYQKYLTAIFSLFFFSVFHSCSEKLQKPVNFVVIYLDDMGYGDLTQTGAIGYQTPNLDKMAAEGLFFTMRPRLFAVHRGPDC